MPHPWAQHDGDGAEACKVRDRWIDAVQLLLLDV